MNDKHIFSSPKRHLIPAVLFLSALSLTGCRNEPAPDLPSGKAGEESVFIDFSIRGGSPEGIPPSRSSAESAPRWGKADGTDGENRIDNLWVLLYRKRRTDAADGNEPLAYRFRFRGTGRPAGTHDAEGNLTPSRMGGETLYTTSVKAVRPGSYRMVVLANTALPSPSGTAGQPSRDVVSDLLLARPGGIDTYSALKAATENAVVRTDGLPSCDRDLNGQGVFSYYTDDDFEAPAGHGTPESPLTKPVGLKRWLSKVRITFTNTDPESGQVFEQAKEYRLVSLTLHNLYSEGNLFEWKDYGGKAAVRQSGPDYADDPSFLKLFPELAGLKERPEEKASGVEVFNHYLIPQGKGMPVRNEADCCYAEIAFARKDADERLSYRIPLYNPDAAVSPEGGKYALLRNTLYEINLVFKGPTSIDVRYNVAEWARKTIEVPAFE